MNEKKVHRRFSLFHRVNHIIAMVSFTGLVVTGMPLKYKTAFWAKSVMSVVGGVAVAGVIHRICAVLTFIYFFLEFLFILYYIFIRRGPILGPDSIVPSKKDIRDAMDMLKWFLGRGPRPKFDRFTYWEKFDYWALILGTIVMGISGLMMWFPEATTRYLPGIALNIALVIHSNEALLAFGVIYIFFHIFNSHLRPEVFPLDPVIFTGKVSLEELRERRPLEYERILQKEETETD